MFVNIKSWNLDSHIFAIKEATFAKKVSLYSVSNYLIISADERCQNGRHVVEKAEKMQKKTEKLLFYWSVVFVTNKIKNKGELIGKQQNRQKHAKKFDLEISLCNKMLIF